MNRIGTNEEAAENIFKEQANQFQEVVSQFDASKEVTKNLLKVSTHR